MAECQRRLRRSHGIALSTNRKNRVLQAAGLNRCYREGSSARAQANASTSTCGRSGDPEHAALQQMAARSHSRINAASRLTIFAQSELGMTGNPCRFKPVDKRV